jgi:hypothetical protein
MKKPNEKTRQYYDYHECQDYLQKKYGYDERNYADHKFTGKPDDAPYQDFWHFVIEMTNLNNGTFIYMNNDWLESAKEPWQKEIIEHYLSEFGKGKNREVQFFVAW